MGSHTDLVTGSSHSPSSGSAAADAAAPAVVRGPGGAASAASPVSTLPAASGHEAPYGVAHHPVKLGRQWLLVQEQIGTRALAECSCGDFEVEGSLGRAVLWMRAHAEAMA